MNRTWQNGAPRQLPWCPAKDILLEDYDNAEIEDKWCEEQRKTVSAYLKKQGVKHGQIGEWPAWHVAPYVSIWAIESFKKRMWIGRWVICGDLPTDYISSSDIEPPQHPRKALNVIASNWLRYVEDWKKGKEQKECHIGGSGSFAELAPLLTQRAKLLREWAEDDSLWEE